MNVVTSVFDTTRDAEGAVQALLQAGYPDDAIGVVVKDSGKGATIADDLGREYASGATPPGEDIFSRTTVWDRLPNGFVNLVHRSELPDESIDWYRGHLDQDHVVVMVNAGDRTQDAVRILRERKGYLYSRERRDDLTRTTTATRPEGEVHLPIIEEEATVERVQRQVGEVRVSSETTSRTVEIPASVTHVELRVERRQLERPLQPEEYQRLSGGTTPGEIRMPIVEEEVRVTKHPVVREELVIIQTPVTEQQTLRETVRHTEPHVETTGDVQERRKGGEERPAA